MRERVNAILLTSTLCVALGGCVSNNGPPLPYPYGVPPPTGVQPGVPPGTVPPPTTGVERAIVPPPTAIAPAARAPAANASAGLAFPNLRRPNWGSPGTIQQQRDWATRFDPYGDDEAGPKIEGGRPREFDRPPAQAARSSTVRSRFIPFANPSW